MNVRAPLIIAVEFGPDLAPVGPPHFGIAITIRDGAASSVHTACGRTLTRVQFAIADVSAFMDDDHCHGCEVGAEKMATDANGAAKRTTDETKETK